MKIAGVISIEAISGPIIYCENLEKHIEKLAELGYDGVEIALRNPEQLDKDKLSKILERTNISSSAIATGQVALIDDLTLTEAGELTMERIMEQINFAASFNAPVIIGLVKGDLPEDSNKNAVKNWVIYACKRCADFAREKGINLLIEVLNRYEANWLNTISEGKDFLAKIDRDNIFLHIDTFHMNIEEVSFRNSILATKDLIGYVHLADSNRWAPGFGHINFKEILSALKEINYEGYLSFEVLPLPDPDTAAKKGIETIRKILAKLPWHQKGKFSEQILKRS